MSDQETKWPSYDTVFGMVRDGVIRRLAAEDRLTKDDISNVNLFCYTHLQSHRDKLEETAQMLKESLPDIFHREIEILVQRIKEAEQAMIRSAER